MAWKHFYVIKKKFICKCGTCLTEEKILTKQVWPVKKQKTGEEKKKKHTQSFRTVFLKMHILH